MRKSLIILMLLGYGASICAQDTIKTTANQNFRQVVKANLWAIACPVVSYELGFARRHAIELSVGISPKLNGGGNFHTYPTNMLFPSLTYRWYFLDTRFVRMFAQGGVSFVYAWGTYDIFAGSDGWDIQTQAYHYSEHRFCPIYGIGVNGGQWKGISLEVQFNPLIAVHFTNEGITPLFDDVRIMYILKHLFCFKVGYSF